MTQCKMNHRTPTKMKRQFIRNYSINFSFFFFLFPFTPLARRRNNGPSPSGRSKPELWSIPETTKTFQRLTVTRSESSRDERFPLQTDEGGCLRRSQDSQSNPSHSSTSPSLPSHLRPDPTCFRPRPRTSPRTRGRRITRELSLFTYHCLV